MLHQRLPIALAGGMEDGQREPDSYHAVETIVRETENEVVPVEVAAVEEADVRYDR